MNSANGIKPWSPLAQFGLRPPLPLLPCRRRGRLRCSIWRDSWIPSWGPTATDLIAGAVVVLELEGTVEEMMFTIHAHPTMSESLLDAYGAVEGMAINA